MSTRANILIKDQWGDSLWFYRHLDGYPEGALPTLSDFMERLASGGIRNNVVQAAGWLIVLGHDEHREIQEKYSFSSWRVGSYEPTTGQHDDIDYLYTLDLQAKTILVDDLSGKTKVIQF